MEQDSNFSTVGKRSGIAQAQAHDQIQAHGVHSGSGSAYNNYVQPPPPPPQSLQTPPQPVPQAPFTHSLTTLLLKTLSNQTLTFHSLAQVTPTNHNRPRTLFQHPLFQLQLRPLRPLRLTLNFLNFLITMIKLLILLILHKIQIRIQSQC